MMKKITKIITNFVVGLVTILALSSAQASTRIELTSKVHSDSSHTLAIVTLIESGRFQINSDSVAFFLELNIDKQPMIESFKLPYFGGFVVIQKFINIKAGKHEFSIRICDAADMTCTEGHDKFKLEYSDVNDILPVYASMTSINRTFENKLEVEITGLADFVEIFMDKNSLGVFKMSEVKNFSVNISKLESGTHVLKVKTQKFEKKFEFTIPFSLISFIKLDYKRGLKSIEPLLVKGNGTLYDIFAEMKKKNEFSDSLFDEFWLNAPMSFENYETLLMFIDQNFYCWQTPGWETDMGRTYIIWGSPDEITKDENGFESIIIWFYWQYNKKFYFTRKSDAACYTEDPFGQFKY